MRAGFAYPDAFESTRAACPLRRPEWERFCQLIVEGKPVTDAYAGSHDTLAMTRQGIGIAGGRLARHPEIVRRIAQLRKPVLEQMRRKFEYTLEQAMEECDQAHLLAEAQRAPEKILKAVELKSKLMRLLVNLSETRSSPLDGVSTEELVELLAYARAQKAKELATLDVTGRLVVENVVDIGRAGSESPGAGRDPEGGGPTLSLESTL